MARYRKVDPRIWNDEKFIALSHMGKLVFLFLMTHPHMTALGAMRQTIPGLAAELQLPEKAFREAFREAFGKGMVEHDESHCFIALPNFIKYNQPENANVLKAWSSALDLLPECAGKFKLIGRVKVFAEGLSEDFKKGLTEAFWKAFRLPLPNQEQEPEQEQEKEQKQNSSRQDSPKRETSSVRKQRANGSKSDWQKYWGPIEKEIRRDVEPDSFNRFYAGIQILDMTAQEIILAIPGAFVSERCAGDRQTAALCMASKIEHADGNFMRERSLRVVTLEERDAFLKQQVKS